MPASIHETEYKEVENINQILEKTEIPERLELKNSIEEYILKDLRRPLFENYHSSGAFFYEFKDKKHKKLGKKTIRRITKAAKIKDKKDIVYLECEAKRLARDTLKNINNELLEKTPKNWEPGTQTRILNDFLSEGRTVVAVINSLENSFQERKQFEKLISNLMVMTWDESGRDGALMPIGLTNKRTISPRIERKKPRQFHSWNSKFLTLDTD